MKKILLIIPTLLLSCTADEDKECICNAQYYNEYINEYNYKLLPCDEIPLTDGDYYFVECKDKPDY